MEVNEPSLSLTEGANLEIMIPGFLLEKALPKKMLSLPNLKKTEENSKAIKPIRLNSWPFHSLPPKTPELKTPHAFDPKKNIEDSEAPEKKLTFMSQNSFGLTSFLSKPRLNSSVGRSPRGRDGGFDTSLHQIRTEEYKEITSNSPEFPNEIANLREQSPPSPLYQEVPSFAYPDQRNRDNRQPDENVDGELPSEEYEKVYKRSLTLFIYKTVKNHFFAHAFMYFVVLFFLFGLDPALVFMNAWISDFFNFVYYGYKICLSKRFHNEKEVLEFESFIETMILVLFKGLIYLNLEEKRQSYTSICFLLVAILCLNVFLLFYLKVLKKVAIFTESVEFGGKFLKFFQIFFMGLKCDGIISWNWKEVFWIYWISFSMMIPISVGFFLLFLGKSYQYFNEHITALEVKGVFTLFLYTCGLTVNSLISSQVFIQCLDNEGGCPQEFLESAFVYFSVFFGVFVLLNLLLWKDILKFVEKISKDESFDESQSYGPNSSNSHSNPMNNLQNSDNSKTSKQDKRLKYERNPLNFIYPQFITKYSSGYFKIFSSNQKSRNAINLIHPIKPTKFRPITKSHRPKKKKPAKEFSSIAFEKSSKQQPPLETHTPRLTTTNKPLFPLTSDRGGVSNLSKYEIENPLRPQASKTSRLNKSDIVVRNYEFDLEKSEISMIERCPSAVKNGENEVAQEKSSMSLSVCVICFLNSPNAVFMDCGHGGICYKCAIAIFKGSGICSMCRNKITEVLNIDLASKKDNVFKIVEVARLEESHNLMI